MKLIDIYKQKYINIKNYYLIISTIGLLLCFLQYTNTYAKYFSAIMILLAVPFLISEIYTKRIFKLPYIKWILTFVLSYSLTILLSAKTDFVSTLHIYIWLIIYMLLFYSSGAECKRDVLNTAQNYYKAIGCFMFVISAIGILTFLFQNFVDTDIFFLGGRARGITIDPIQLSWIAYISLTSAVSIFTIPSISKPWRVFSIISVITSICAILVTMTRNTEYGVIGYIGIMSFLSIYIFLYKNKSKVFIKSLLISIVIVGITMFSFSGMKSVITWTSNLTKQTQKQPTEVIDNLERTDYHNGVLKYGLSGRFEIWTMGLNVVKEYPILGVGSGDMKYQSVKINKNTEVYKQTYPYFHDKVFISQHNGFMQVLVASGISGLLLTTVFMVLLSYKVLKYIFTSRNEKDIYFIASLAANVAVVFYVLSFGQSISYFLLSYFSAYFWITLGYLSNILNKKTVKEESKG